MINGIIIMGVIIFMAAFLGGVEKIFVSTTVFTLRYIGMGLMILGLILKRHQSGRGS